MEMTVKNSPPLVHTHSVCASGSDIREPRGALSVCVFEISSLSQPSHWADELVTCSSGTLRNERSFQRPRFHPLHLTIAGRCDSQPAWINNSPLLAWAAQTHTWWRSLRHEKTLAFIILKCGISVSPDTMWWSRAGRVSESIWFSPGTAANKLDLNQITVTWDPNHPLNLIRLKCDTLLISF